MSEEVVYKYYLEIESSIHLLTAKEIAIALGICSRNSKHQSGSDFIPNVKTVGKVLSALEKQEDCQPIYYKARNLLRVYRIETIFKFIKYIEKKMPNNTTLKVIPIQITPFTVLYVDKDRFMDMKHKLNL